MSLKEKAGDDSSGILERFDLGGMWVDWKKKGLQ